MSHADYIKSITSMNTLAISAITTGEIKRYSKSDIHWVRVKNSHFNNIRFRKGDVYQFEFGKCPIPEMAYEHRGLILGVAGKLLYVLPICSFKAHNREHCNAYHKKDNPSGNDEFFLLKTDGFPFLRHDSILKTNELKTVSIKRALYSHGRIDISGDMYKSIERKAFYKCFPSFSFKYDEQKQDTIKLTEQLEKSSEYIKQLQSEHEDLKQKYKDLQKELRTLKEQSKDTN